MKRCFKCQQDKPFSEFGKNRAKPDGLQNQCRPCKQETDRRYYSEDSQGWADRKNARRAVARQRMWELLSQSACTDCGLTDPVVLEFDHLEEKAHNIAEMLGQGWSWTAISKEIAKCEIVCSNCHRHRTYTRAGTWRWQQANPG